jgi:hypothetical protein
MLFLRSPLTGRMSFPEVGRRKGYWRMSANRIVQQAMTNEWLEEQGVPNMRTLWIKLYYGPNARI